MIPRSDCESLPKPTPSPCTRVPFSVSLFHCRRVVNKVASLVPLPARTVVSFVKFRVILGSTPTTDPLTRTSAEKPKLSPSAAVWSIPATAIAGTVVHS